MDLIFIVGIARTGSKIYMQMLNDHTDIDVVSEMHYLAPWYVRRDFVRSVMLMTSELSTDAGVVGLASLMNSGQLKGTFWKRPLRKEGPFNKFADLDHEAVRELIIKSDRSFKSIFRIILEEHARVMGKVRAGAKFPVEISCVPKLMEWFPDAKFVHIVRDPRASYVSNMRADIKRHDARTTIGHSLARSRRLLHICDQFRRAAKLYSEFSGNQNYYLSRFEDIIVDSETRIQLLCEFLCVDYNKKMLYPKVVNSSYDKSHVNTGMDAKAVDEWRKYIAPMDRKILEACLRRSMKTLGYMSIK